MLAPRWITLTLLSCACSHGRDQAALRAEIEDVTGANVDLERTPDRAPTLPEGVVLGDGLAADEAVAIALWNSPSLRADLTRLDAAQAELADARRPANPTLKLLFPAGPQQLSALLTWPLEAFVTMPGRINLASTNLDAVAQSIVQTSVELTRDVRLAHADWLLAHDRIALREQLASEREEVLTILETQATLGDLPERDVETARAEAAIADDEARRAQADVQVASARLRGLMGFALDELELKVEPEVATLTSSGLDSLGSLERVALDSRPDLRAAELAVESAQVRLRVERASIFNLSGLVQVDGQPGGGLAATGGVQAVLPIFSQNQAGRGRARAGLEAAQWRERGLRERIVGELRDAHARLGQAIESHDAYREGIVITRERALAAARLAWDLGEGDFVSVVLAEQNLDTARLREVELRADVRRAQADLERALGRRLASVDSSSSSSADEETR